MLGVVFFSHPSNIMTILVREELCMYEFFYKLDKEKQTRIINSSLQIFSINDFKHASTDDIAAKAKISKGSLFQ